MLGVELTLFIIIGAIAILAAVMMLVSENAVHSALFLILNFACVAFFYLMLNAPFLAMVQVTVYAGAIMVLFLFVIMLLGAEKLTPESSPQFTWLTPAAIGLTTLFLFVASIAILRSDVGATEPEPTDPLLRVAHAVSGAPNVDVYVNGEKIADDLEFRHASSYETLNAGEYTATVYAHGDDPSATEPIFEAPVFLNGDEAVTLLVLPNTQNGGVTAMEVTGSLAALEEDNNTALTVVHAMPCPDGGTTCAVDVADISTPSDDPVILVSNLNYGEVSAIQTLEADEYTLGIFPAGLIADRLATATDDAPAKFNDALAEIKERTLDGNTSVLWLVVADARGEFVRPQNIFIEDMNQDSFGSGQGIGRILYTTYAWPFFAIALMLLVAMMGVIVLTNPLDGTKPMGHQSRPRRMAAIEGNPTIEEYEKALKDGSVRGAGD